MISNHIENLCDPVFGYLKKDKLPSTPETQAIRTELPDLLVRNSDLPGIPDISVLVKSKDRPWDEDCEAYIFPEWSKGGTSVDTILREWKNVTSEPGAIAIYLDDDNNFTHVGKVSDDNKLIVSKWGFGHVYLHKRELVPDFYGTTISYFKPAK